MSRTNSFLGESAVMILSSAIASGLGVKVAELYQKEIIAKGRAVTQLWRPALS